MGVGGQAYNISRSKRRINVSPSLVLGTETLMSFNETPKDVVVDPMTLSNECRGTP